MTTLETNPTMEDASRAMGADATYLGGGTVVMRAVNEGVATPRLIRVTDPGLTQISTVGETFRLGASVTMADVLAHRDLAFLHPVARQIGGPQVRNMATVAGNLFAEHPYGDFATALLALGAQVTMTGQGGALPIDDVLRDRDRAGLVSAVDIPRPRDVRAFGFRKVSRVRPKGVSVLCIAAYLPRESGRIRGARVAFGAMGPTPLRSSGAERALEGHMLDSGTVDGAAAAATEGLSPSTDQIATEWYRREVAGVHLKRLLTEMERG